jgi:hypothetical protein
MSGFTQQTDIDRLLELLETRQDIYDELKMKMKMKMKI